ncbi:hypothetical protein [Micromonospora sp. KC721]|uniref:hypothetical protein n=1 Tax=Micromonospora sp. KC721 TaxID=2530380 RepID=UPI00104347BE|nr:hypothetical protein [Micromonospora sp. KC721]TDB79624.1 hypothetical protein E1182_12085 [Micromonospora sp. KC721]
MADPAEVTLTQLRNAFAPLGIVLDEDFVRLELRENALTIHRLVRTTSGMPACLPDGGVQCTATAVAVAAEPPPGPEA